jgi:thiol-disulfide isomerase/thioredoxin
MVRTSTVTRSSRFGTRPKRRSLSLSLTSTVRYLILSHLYFTYLFALDLNLGIFIFLYGRCPPCKMIKPVYESLSEEYPDISFGKIDIDDNQDSAMEYEISSVPTFVFFNDKGEKKYGQFSGADQEQLKKIIDDLNKEP